MRLHWGEDTTQKGAKRMLYFGSDTGRKVGGGAREDLTPNEKRF